jgi:hypothetical protein
LPGLDFRSPLLTGLVLPALLLTTLARFVLAALLTTLVLLAALLLLVLILLVWIAHRFFLMLTSVVKTNGWQTASFLCHLTQLGTIVVSETCPLHPRMARARCLLSAIADISSSFARQ